jgi:EAL domain-containing protein (putative c-di-GMP-specific phosphodiesterase class I)
VTLGCAIGQGWYFGKPMPAEQARELLTARRRASELPLSDTPSAAHG